MREKNNFVQYCKDNGMKQKSAEQLWTSLLELRAKIKSAWDITTQMRQYSEQQMVELRNAAAENGMELTPEELYKTVQIMGIIQDDIAAIDKDDWELDV